MQQSGGLFSLPHLAVIIAVPVIAAILALLAGRRPRRTRRIRIMLAAFLILNAGAAIVIGVLSGYIRFPRGLPIQLCDVVLFLTIVVVLWLHQFSFDLAYYGAMAGSSMAVLTPDVEGGLLSLAAVQFMILHGGVIVAVLFLVWARLLQPSPGSVWRAFLFLNLYAGAIALFNIIFDTNYFYLREKPQQPSLLDYMGPWPLYILVGELVALGLFGLLWLPFARTFTRRFALQPR